MPQLVFSPTVVDFGHLVCERQLTSRLLKITNSGFKLAKVICLVDRLPSSITVSPEQAELEPGGMVYIKVSKMFFDLLLHKLLEY